MLFFLGLPATLQLNRNRRAKKTHNRHRMSMKSNKLHLYAGLFSSTGCNSFPWTLLSCQCTGHSISDSLDISRCLRKLSAVQCSAKRNNLINGFFNKNLTPGRMAEFPRGRLRKRVTRLTFFTPIKRVLKVVCLSVGATCNNIHVLENNFSCFKLQFVLPQQT